MTIDVFKPGAIRIIIIYTHGEAETYVVHEWPSPYYLRGLIHGEQKVCEIRVEAVYLSSIVD